MNYVIDYFFESWPLLLVLIAFGIMLSITVFIDRKRIIKMYILILVVFLLSVSVYIEFLLEELKMLPDLRLVLMAIRYSSTPVIIALVSYALVNRTHWYVLLPSFVLALINIISIFTGIVFALDSNGDLQRGVLGFLPYVGVGGYAAFLIVLLFLQSHKQMTEIIPIVFMALAFSSGLVFPFIVGKEYSKIFCTTIAIALFVYYVFMILQLTKKDALTGLLNRQAYYAFVRDNKEITAFVSIDMNGLKAINDNGGHIAGDIALISLANCFSKATKNKQYVYRLGGDEFVILCKKTDEEELKQLINRIKDNVAKTKYSCSIGYCYSPNADMGVDDMAKASDQMMYLDKAEYYKRNNLSRRKE